MNRSATPMIRQGFMACAALACIPVTASWPGPQWIFHALLVLGLAPEFRSPVVSMLWAAAAGWALEGSLRFYTHLGGTALADMTLCLIVRWTLIQWPPQGRNAFVARLAVFTLLLALAVHTAVRIAAGPHTWGTGVIWALVAVPLWGTLAFRNLRPIRS
jgi:hypothetical protein